MFIMAWNTHQLFGSLESKMVQLNISLCPFYTGTMYKKWMSSKNFQLDACGHFQNSHRSQLIFVYFIPNADKSMYILFSIV